MENFDITIACFHHLLKGLIQLISSNKPFAYSLTNPCDFQIEIFYKTMTSVTSTKYEKRELSVPAYLVAIYLESWFMGKLMLVLTNGWIEN